MTIYTVQLAYMQGYSQTVEVEANSVEEACEKAYAEPDDCWRSYDDCGDTYVEAIGFNGEAWDTKNYGSALPVPRKHAEETVRLRALLREAFPALVNSQASRDLLLEIQREI